jgi:hypothetical protein
MTQKSPYKTVRYYGPLITKDVQKTLKYVSHHYFWCLSMCSGDRLLVWQKLANDNEFSGFYAFDLKFTSQETLTHYTSWWCNYTKLIQNCYLSLCFKIYRLYTKYLKNLILTSYFDFE